MSFGAMLAAGVIMLVAWATGVARSKEVLSGGYLIVYGVISTFVEPFDGFSLFRLLLFTLLGGGVMFLWGAASDQANSEKKVEVAKRDPLLRYSDLPDEQTTPKNPNE